jgi:hypothetical protein
LVLPNHERFEKTKTENMQQPTLLQTAALELQTQPAFCVTARTSTHSSGSLHTHTIMFISAATDMSVAWAWTSATMVSTCGAAWM